MWKAPFRPRESEISQSYNDGLVDVYRQTDAAKPGYAPQPTLELVVTLAFEFQRVGLQRYYAALQNQIQIEHVIRVQKGAVPLNTQMVAIIRGQNGQYQINMIQGVPDVYPPSLDLTLSRVAQILTVEEVDHDVV